MIGLLASILPSALSILDDYIPNKTEANRAKAKLEASLISLTSEANKSQARINEVSVGHRSMWVAGWRPAIGWTCATGVFWAYVGHPLALWTLAMAGSSIVLPEIATGGLMELTMGLLGLAGLRTFEKYKGITK